MKRIIIFIVVFLILIVIGTSIYINWNKKTDVVGESEEGTVDVFELSNYKDIMEQFPLEKTLGPIETAQKAKNEAEKIWIEIYGESIKDMKPYNVFFDEETQVWLVQGTLPRNFLGGVPHILIRKLDGKVLAVWHDK